MARLDRFKSASKDDFFLPCFILLNQKYWTILGCQISNKMNGAFRKESFRANGIMYTATIHVFLTLEEKTFKVASRKDK